MNTRKSSPFSVLIPCLLVILGLGSGCFEVKADASSSIGLMKLVSTEKAISKALVDFYYRQEEKLLTLKRIATEFQEANEEAQKDANAYISNPINAYSLIKRLLTDWETAKYTINDLYEEAKKMKNTRMENLVMPTSQDLDETKESLIRLQDTYLLDTKLMANGSVRGAQVRTKLSASDCFSFGKSLHQAGSINRSLSWFNEALEKIEKEENASKAIHLEILQVTGESLFKLGYMSKGRRTINKMLIIDPSNEWALRTLSVYKYKQDSLTTENKTSPYENYNALCRNEIRPLQELTSKLKCRYVHKGNAFLRLAPIKEEELYLDPRIVMFRQILYDSEIEEIKDVSVDLMTRSGVVNAKDGGSVFSNVRVSAIAWLMHHISPLVSKLDKRSEYITGLTTTTSELFQVANYGIGGHYLPHFDYFEEVKANAMNLNFGNRIATLLFYLNDVDEGGTTAFPNLNIVVKPEKGSAVFWHNLHASGVPDRRTIHAACPVLIGTKWAINKWFRLHGQEFRSPCHLQRHKAELLEQASAGR